MENFIIDDAKIIRSPEQDKKELLRQVTAYINAGGRGTRLESILAKDPKIGITKSLIKFGGKDPIIKYHVDRLIKKGFNNVVVNAGDHFNVNEYFSDKKSEKLRVVNSEIQEGTGGDLIKAIRQLPNIGKYLLINNSDTLIDVDESDVLTRHKESGADATFVITRKVSKNPNYYVGKNGRIIFSHKADQKYNVPEPHEDDIAYKAGSTGVVVFNTDTIRDYSWQSGDGELSIYSQIVGKFIKEGRVFAYDNGNKFFVDMGTPDDYKKIMIHPELKKILEARF